MNKISDTKLVHSYINGDENAIAVLLNRHKDKVYSYIYFKLNDKELSEDIFQDTFIKIITTLKENRYNDEGKFINWCLRIAHNMVIDHFRRQSKTQFISETSFENEEYSIWDFISSPEECIEDKFVNEQIENDLKTILYLLPTDQQEIINLRIFRGYSFKEISEETGISINTALGRMRYALMNLRKIIKENNIILS